MARKSKPTVHLVGHGHLDPTWLWRWMEGCATARGTFRSALDRMRETPAFRFTASSACFYAWVKETDPAVFAEIQRRVREGRWELAGGWWIEPDCNIPCGEAFVRQGLYGQRFFEREFGRRAVVGFNPDSFGHAAQLPQILRKLGLRHYAYLRPSPPLEREYPGGATFWWEAPDGSRVLASNIQHNYGCWSDVKGQVTRLLEKGVHNEDQAQFLCFYGVGNHGGGPTIAIIDEIKKLQKDAAGPRLEFSTLEKFFEDFAAHQPEKTIPSVRGELQYHARGCFSAHSEIKRMNRAAEHALMTAERWALAASLATDFTYPRERLEEAWRDVLYNQFHDILAGSSIEPAYQDARDQLGAARQRATEIINASTQSLAAHIDTRGPGNPAIVHNPLPWPVRRPVVLGQTFSGAWDLEGGGIDLHVEDERGVKHPAQKVYSGTSVFCAYQFLAEIPAMGYRCYRALPGLHTPKKAKPLSYSNYVLENSWWRIAFDPQGGYMTQLRDKKHRTEVLTRGAVLQVLVDGADTWGHGVNNWDVVEAEMGGAVFRVVEEGDISLTLRITSHYGMSTADAFVTLYRELPIIDYVLRVNWQQPYKMLKLAFDTTIERGTATYETPYGFDVRPANGGEEPGQAWFDLTGRVAGRPYGLAVLNDGKYSFDVRRKTMRTTVLRTPAYAHHDPYSWDPIAPFTFLDIGLQTTRFQIVPHAGAWQDASVVRQAWELNEPLFAQLECSHKGTLPSAQSFLEVDAPNVIVNVFKQSEDGRDLILRGYEACGRRTRTEVRVAGVKTPLRLTFAPHEIKTLRIDRKTGKAREVNLLEETE